MEAKHFFVLDFHLLDLLSFAHIASARPLTAKYLLEDSPSKFYSYIGFAEENAPCHTLNQ